MQSHLLYHHINTTALKNESEALNPVIRKYALLKKLSQLVIEDKTVGESPIMSRGSSITKNWRAHKFIGIPP